MCVPTGCCHSKPILLWLHYAVCSPFGWNILETNRTVGGLLGYSSVNSRVSLNVPSSNGVSWGLRTNDKSLKKNARASLCTGHHCATRNTGIQKQLTWQALWHLCRLEFSLPTRHFSHFLFNYTAQHLKSFQLAKEAQKRAAVYIRMWRHFTTRPWALPRVLNKSSLSMNSPLRCLHNRGTTWVVCMLTQI